MFLASDTTGLFPTHTSLGRATKVYLVIHCSIFLIHSRQWMRMPAMIIGTPPLLAPPLKLPMLINIGRPLVILPMWCERYKIMLGLFKSLTSAWNPSGSFRFFKIGVPSFFRQNTAVSSKPSSEKLRWGVCSYHHVGVRFRPVGDAAVSWKRCEN